MAHAESKPCARLGAGAGRWRVTCERGGAQGNRASDCAPPAPREPATEDRLSGRDGHPDVIAMREWMAVAAAQCLSWNPLPSGTREPDHPPKRPDMAPFDKLRDRRHKLRDRRHKLRDRRLGPGYTRSSPFDKLRDRRHKAQRTCGVAPSKAQGTPEPRVSCVLSASHP